jgi:hypothetical protein
MAVVEEVEALMTGDEATGPNVVKLSSCRVVVRGV